MKNMNCVSTMPEIMPEITDEAIIEALFAQRPYEEKVINSAFLEIPAEYQRKLNIPNVEKMSAEFTELIANPPKVSYRDGHYFVFDGQHTIVRRAGNVPAVQQAAFHLDGFQCFQQLLKGAVDFRAVALDFREILHRKLSSSCVSSAEIHAACTGQARNEKARFMQTLRYAVCVNLVLITESVVNRSRNRACDCSNGQLKHLRR